MTSAAALLEVTALNVGFAGRRHGAPIARVVCDLSFSIAAGETLAIVGESGCGKSTCALALMGLLSARSARVVASAIRFGANNLLDLSEAGWRKLRGGEIGMIFQDPLSALNPVRTVGSQIAEALQQHQGLRGAAARAEALNLLRQVRMPEPERRLDEYPHRLSGGMRQRVLIAMALAGQPRLLIADEPTTALDVTVQAQILELLAELQRERNMALLLITHDLGVVSQIADRVLVMYAGRKVEERQANSVFDDAQHPYTRSLLRSRPGRETVRTRLVEIPGAVPAPGAHSDGCAFAPRCASAQAQCWHTEPPWQAVHGGHARCVLAGIEDAISREHIHAA